MPHDGDAGYWIARRFSKLLRCNIAVPAMAKRALKPGRERPGNTLSAH